MRSPKLYVRHSGLLHALLGLDDHDALAGHPVYGHSWEGVVVETVLALLRIGNIIAKRGVPRSHLARRRARCRGQTAVAGSLEVSVGLSGRDQPGDLWRVGGSRQARAARRHGQASWMTPFM